MLHHDGWGTGCSLECFNCRRIGDIKLIAPLASTTAETASWISICTVHSIISSWVFVVYLLSPQHWLMSMTLALDRNLLWRHVPQNCWAHCSAWPQQCTISCPKRCSKRLCGCPQFWHSHPQYSILWMSPSLQCFSSSHSAPPHQLVSFIDTLSSLSLHI